MSLARCDLCLGADGRNGMTLVTCEKCNVSVHQECYGLTEMSVVKFAKGCPACKSVGKVIEGRTQKGNMKQVRQMERPSECVLCSISTGAHAMHPLYDVEGPTGRHLVLPSGNLAWVHTLCANGVCQNRTTAGCVYGVDITGTLNDDSDASDASDNSHNGPIDVTLHHFIMCTPKDPDYWHVIEESRKLVCIGCGKKGGLRFPVQCTAGDENENAQLRTLHKHFGEPCMQAMHLGCAMWGPDLGTHSRVFFDPGSDTTDAVFECYCPRHLDPILGSKNPDNATGIKRKRVLELPRKPNSTVTPVLMASASRRECAKPAKRIENRLPPMSLSQPTSGKLRRPSALSAAKSLKGKDPIISDLPPSRLDPSIGVLTPKMRPTTVAKSTKEIIASDNANDIVPLSGSVPRKKIKTVTRDLASYVTAAQKVVTPPIGKSTTHQQLTLSKSTKDLPPPPLYQRNSVVAKIRQVPTVKKSALFFPDKVQNDVTTVSQLEDSGESAPVGTKPRPVRRRYISESKTSDDDFYPEDFDWLGLMFSDVENALTLGKQDGIDAREIVEARRCYWRRKSGIYGTDFIELWNRVSEKFARSLDSRVDVAPPSEPEINVTLKFDVDEDVDQIPSSSNNKWDTMWRDSAYLFEFGDWDTTTEVMKRDLNET